MSVRVSVCVSIYSRVCKCRCGRVCVYVCVLGAQALWLARGNFAGLWFPFKPQLPCEPHCVNGEGGRPAVVKGQGSFPFISYSSWISSFVKYAKSELLPKYSLKRQKISAPI